MPDTRDYTHDYDENGYHWVAKCTACQFVFAELKRQEERHCLSARSTCHWDSDCMQTCECSCAGCKAAKQAWRDAQPNEAA